MKNMKSKLNHTLFLTGLLAGGALLVAGCGNNSATNNLKNNNADKNNASVNFNGARNVSSSFDNFLENSTTGTLSNLAIGKRIMVSGTANTDGSITASRIMIGELPIREKNEDQPVGIAPGNGGSQPGNFDDNEAQPNDSNFPRPTGDNSGSRPNAGNSNANRQNGREMTSGEIIKMDSTSLILNTITNGTKLIFYSATTPIYILQLPTNTPNGLPAISTSSIPN